MNKCPHCERTISKVEVEDIDLAVHGMKKWRGFSYACPYCRKIISVQMNPLTLAVDYADEVEDRLRK